MSFKELKLYWFSDLYRYEETMKVSMWKVFYRRFMIAGFHYMFWVRLCKYLSQKGKFMFPIYMISMFLLQRYKYKYGISISPGTKIGKGFYIGHFGDINVSSLSEIGDNCVIMQGVTIGASGRGEKRGAPIIGNFVYMGPGAKIIGKIKIGNNVIIGANAVVTNDIPDNGVAVGIPAKVISLKGSDGYIGFPFPIETYMEKLGIKQTNHQSDKIVTDKVLT
ncbi:serine acetyltransferase [Paenibacillus sp. GSMTC-2017]|uniref:serine O-acetyltransferase n=1 Tax=Paenibacillus sp. GSMTC-2017 TaxID=2794350 RepID=UPI0018D99DB1|nr:serine O-acetyltransferase [Paenibacillus sp. GSMTC-2017]MBH5316860.1 serine acetyltransferase [Paenibacillus sp. GSMTC-2017]